MIKIYGTGGCLACLKAKQTAQIFELDYEYIDLSKADIETKKTFFNIDKSGGAMVPQIVWGDKVLVGLPEFEEHVNIFLKSKEE